MNNKNSGYYEFNHKKNEGKQLMDGLTDILHLKKARLSDDIIYTDNLL